VEAETDDCKLLLSLLRSRALCCSRSECFVEELELLEEEEEEEEEPRDELADALTEAEALAAVGLIHCAPAQSAPTSGPVSQRAVGLQSDTVPFASQACTFQKYAVVA